MYISIEVLSTGFIVTVSESAPIGGIDFKSLFKGVMPSSPLDEQIQESLNQQNPITRYIGKHVFEHQNDMLAFVQKLTTGS